MDNNASCATSPLPSDGKSAAARRGCLECGAWLAREAQHSDGAASRSATKGAAQRHAAPETITAPRHPSTREHAFDAAQRLVLSQPHMAIGQLEQNRMADYILEMAGKFERWMLESEACGCADAPQKGCMSGWNVMPDDAAAQSSDIADEAAALDAADPVIDAYIESERRAMSMMAMMDKLKPLDTQLIASGLVQASADMSARMETYYAVANALDKRRRSL